MQVGIELRSYRFRKPLHTSFGTLRVRETLVLTLTDHDGVTGRGEAAPLQAYDGVALHSVKLALERYRAVLEQADELSGSRVIDSCRRIADLPHAIAAVDTALWERAALREGCPVSELLTDGAAWAVPVNATVGDEDRAGAARAAAAAAEQGFECVKVKVGVGDDAGRIAAVRAAIGPDVALRVDANGAWSVEQAIASIGALAPAGLELVEEPVHGVHALTQVRRAVPVRIAMDETAAEPGALASGCADAVALKLGRSAGISGLLAAAELVRATGAEPYVTSVLDGPIGVAAALHAAAALGAGRDMLACGLATLALFEGVDELVPVDGAIAVPDVPGLGV